MPRYKNISDRYISQAGITIYPGEEKAVDKYLYHEDLVKLSEYPIPEIVTRAATFNITTDEVVEVDIEDIQHLEVEFIVQVLSGNAKIYYNDLTTPGISFSGTFHDRISARYLDKILIRGTAEGTYGSYVVKRVI